MFKRDWLNGFAFGVVAGFLLTPALIFAAIVFGGAPDYLGYPNAHQQNGEQSAPQDQRWWLISRVVYMDDTAAQWIMMITTIIATILLLRTLWATQDMARDTREIGEAQVRAYITVDKVTVSPEIIEGRDYIQWQADVFVRNSGQSPARNVFMVVEGHGFNTTGGGRTGSLASGGSDKVSALLTMDDASVSLIDERYVMLTIKVNISFLDVFSDTIPNTETFEFVNLAELVNGVETELFSIGVVIDSSSEAAAPDRKERG